jgi:hypothetical protein
VSAAGLVPVLRLAESAGLYALVEEHLSVDSPNATAKTTSVIGGVLAGADSIDDLDLLRHGGMPRLFGGVRAPSTLGTFLRSFTHGHVQQLDAVGGRLLAGLTGRVAELIAGAENLEGIAFIDVDDTVREVHGYAKQAAAYGYTGKRGLNIQVATISTPLTAPVIGRARLRKGNTASAAGAGRMLAQTITTARASRADSAFYGYAFVGTAIRHKVWFSVTARMDPKVKTAIAGIAENAWVAIGYPNAVWEDDQTAPGGGYWVSDAEVAEIEFTAFITNSTLGMIEADQRHRDHAIVEQVIAEPKDNALAHLPSGKYAANAAWVSMAVIAFNIARASAVAADLAKARWATVRTTIIKVPGRIASTTRRLDLHLPTRWPWAQAWESLHAVATGPPRTAAT